VLPLSDRQAQSPARTGVKAATLAKLTAAGLPVPPGFVISTAAFQSVLENLPRRAKRRNALLDAPIALDLRTAILTAYVSMGSGSVSVRSSSNAEDLSETSFAGQYDSFLNIRSRRALFQAIQKVWASLYSEHAISYRRRHGIAEADVRMAILVQRQLDPHAAGVLFTRDPLDPDERSRLVISAALGLGEGVVSGSAQADRFVLNSRSGKMVSSHITRKRDKIESAPVGGIRNAEVKQSNQERPALSPAHLKALAKHGRAIVARFKGPQDIEFAVVGRKVHILQARPMTAIGEVQPDQPWDEGLDRRYTWRLRGRPVPRLQEEYGALLNKHAGDCYKRTGASMTAEHIAHKTNGYTWLRAPKVTKKELQNRLDRQRKRADRSLRKGKSYYEDVLRPIIEDRLGALQTQHRKAKDLPDLVRYLEAALEFTSYVQGHLHWAQIRPGEPDELRKVYHDITGEPESAASVFLQAIQNRMTRLIVRLRELARIAQADPLLRQLLVEHRFSDLESPRIRRRAAARRFQERFAKMLAIYGLRAGHGYGASTDFLTPTWNMDPTQPLEIIASYVEQDLDRLDELDREARSERILATERARRRLAGDPPALERFNDSLFTETIRARSLEDHNYAMEGWARGTLREAIHIVGTKLLSRGLIDHSDDIRYFGAKDLKALARRSTPPDQRPFVREGIAEIEHRKRMKAPAILGKQPKPAKRTRPAAEQKDATKTPDSTLRGNSACRGKATGEAVVIRPGRPRPRLRPGDILVASNVGPDWTPSFGVIAGLVLDSGSLWQHAGVMAREYRIPTVMNTEEATKHIVDGQRITVDGDRGIVELDA